MSRARWRILIGVGGSVVLLVLVAVFGSRALDVNRYKPRFEAAASDALGMDVRVGGRIGLGLFPGFHITVEDVQLLGERGETIISARRFSLWPELLPLLRRRLRLRRIELTQPRFSIERDLAGRLNVEKLRKALALVDNLDRASVVLSDGALVYADRRTGKGFEATGFDLTVSGIQLAGGTGATPLVGLSLQARLACAEIRTKDFSLSGLKATVDGKNGVFEVTPVTLQLFGGQAVGSLRADLSGAVPQLQLRCSLPGFRLEEFLKTLSPQTAAVGAMDFSASLSMHGNTASQLIGTAMGQISMRGEHLTLRGNDLDLALARFASSQNFNLVDVGAVFLAGPVGLAVTKGYNFSGLFRGTGGHTDIGILVSNWRVERGVAQATDVALATARNRIALQGGLDFVHGQFADVTVAVIDAKGCAEIRQAIRGSFGKPIVEKPRVLRSLAGPVLKLFKRARGMFPAGPCEAFYTGSVPAPA